MRINESPERFFERDGSGKGFVCPVCGSGSGKHGTGLRQWRKNPDHWHCFGECGTGGDVVFWLMKSRNEDYSTVLKYGARVLGEEAISNPSSYKRKIDKPVEEVEEEQQDYTALYEEAAKHLEETCYWKERGLSLETCQRFGLGYIEKWRHPKAPEIVPYSPRLIIPISKGGYLARDVRVEVPEAEKKYTKAKVGKVQLFNLEALKQRIVYVVEGELDAISMYEVGLEAIALGSVAYKGKLIEAIKSMEEKPEIVVLALDNDEAGRNASENVQNALQRIGVSSIGVNLYGKSKDANEALRVSRNELAKKVVEVTKNLVNKKMRNRKMKKRWTYFEENRLEMDIEEYQKNRERKTGYSNLDEKSSLYAGLYVLGAISSLGKTTFMHQMAEQMLEQGETVIYISYEQTQFELISKGISRLTYKLGNGVSSMQIRNGATGDSIKEAIRKYKEAGEREYVYEAEFTDTVEVICKEIESLINEGIENPIVIVDYLQVIAASKDEHGRVLGTKENIDHIVKRLKALQREYGLVVFLISSLNRQNYLAQVDFESFKESGGIEYTADVVWGMQLTCMQEPIFEKAANLNEKRERVREAKAANPREVEVICLKSRYTTPGYRCLFNYYPQYDYFEVCNKEETKKAVQSAALSKPQYKGKDIDRSLVS